MYIKAMDTKKRLMGDPEKDATQHGPVVDKSQYERIMGIISNAKKEKEGTLVYGGNRLGDKVFFILRYDVHQRLTAIQGLLY
jgi:aldehyde dehydrogenase (NAD+)/retinal dehydrogenase